MHQPVAGRPKLGLARLCVYENARGEGLSTGRQTEQGRAERKDLEIGAVDELLVGECVVTFKRHFVSVLASTHPAFPINHWPELLPQAEMTLNMMRPYADLPTISAYNGVHREPYDFLSHPIAFCGTLIVAHNPRRETWDNFGTVGFYLGPSLEHYRSYRCLTSDSDDICISDNMNHPLPCPPCSPRCLSLRSVALPHASASAFTGHSPIRPTSLLPMPSTTHAVSKLRCYHAIPTHTSSPHASI